MSEKKNKIEIYFHTDASQGIGKIPLKVSMGFDFMTIAGHKIYAPKGIAALYSKYDLPKLIHGAGHEMNHRAGTENVPYIVGLGAAMEIIVNVVVNR